MDVSVCVCVCVCTCTCSEVTVCMLLLMQVPKDRHGLSSGFYSLDSSTTISYNILVCSCLFLAGIVSIWKDSPLRFHV